MKKRIKVVYNQVKFMRNWVKVINNHANVWWKQADVCLRTRVKITFPVADCYNEK